MLVKQFIFTTENSAERIEFEIHIIIIIFQTTMIMYYTMLISCWGEDNPFSVDTVSGFFSNVLRYFPGREHLRSHISTGWIKLMLESVSVPFSLEFVAPFSISFFTCTWHHIYTVHWARDCFIRLNEEYENNDSMEYLPGYCFCCHFSVDRNQL